MNDCYHSRGRLLIRSIPFVLALAGALRLFGAETGQLDASEPLFTVMAAANAAGYDAGLATSPQLRQQVRESVAATQAPVIQKLKAWYHANPAENKYQDLARFITLGLSVNGAPDFGWSKREVEVPPDARAMDEFRLLLPSFYADAKIGDLWRQSQHAVDSALNTYQEPVAKAVLEANAYLRNPQSGFLGRRFQIFIDFLGAPNQVQTRSFGDDYFVVLTPSEDPRIADIRHAYFRYLIDPLAIKYGMELKEKDSLMDIAEGAPLLSGQYRLDFGLLATECLIKAVESRLNSNPSMIDQALREGYILTPFFNEQLALYEKQPDSMKLYFPVMVKTLSVKREIRRLENVKFATEPTQAPLKKVEVRPAGPSSLAARTVVEADGLYYDKQDLEAARKLYTKALEQPGTTAEHSRAFFGLAHIAMKQKDPETADQLFRKTLESSPDPETQAWSCYYLGRLSEISDNKAESSKWFSQAVGVPGAPPEVIESIRKKIADAAH